MRNHFLIIIIVIIALFNALIAILQPCEPVNINIQKVCLFEILFACLIWFWNQQHTHFKGFWHKPSNLIFLGMIIVYYQPIIDLCIGYKTVSNFVYPNILNKSTLISTVGILGFLLGYICYNCSYNTPSNKSLSINNKKQSFTPIIIVQLISFVGFLATVDISSLLAGTNYSGSKGTSLYTYFELLIEATNIYMLLKIAKSKSNFSSIKDFLKAIPVVSFLIFIIYISLRIVSGDRGPVIYLLLSFFYTYSYVTRKKIKLLIIMGLCLVGSIGVSIIGIARGLDLNMSFSERISSASNTFNSEGRFIGEKSISPATAELAFSHLSYQIICNELYQHDDSYKKGACQITGILSTIPFVSGFIHNTLGISKENTVSAYYATYKYIGKNPTWGTGTNIVGDFLLDFGIIGVLLCMYMVGIYFKKIDYSIFFREKQHISDYFLALILLTSCRAIYIPRADFLAFLKPCIFCWIIMYIMRKILKES